MDRSATRWLPRTIRGSYRPDPDGRWRYEAGSQVVPGARDITAAEWYLPCARTLHGGRRGVLVDGGDGRS